MVGVKPWATTATELKNDAAVRIYIISQNVHRRHLTPEQRQERLEAVIVANPEKSDREIAREAKLQDHKKVGRARKKLESTGAIAPVEKRTGKDGKARTTTPKPKKLTEPQVRRRRHQRGSGRARRNRRRAAQSRERGSRGRR